MANAFIVGRAESGVVVGRVVGMRVAGDGITPLINTNQAPWGIEIPEYLTEAILGLLDRLEEVAQGAEV
ncbi:hypothetical protein AB0K74_29860 [Streptomyces sp. NPDC056159]|uniref:hypothetical protein n=1 Tax=Streptomyces sp. NPDC056159 TaxID=3155537 RepID=UPI003413FD84